MDVLLITREHIINHYRTSPYGGFFFTPDTSLDAKQPFQGKACFIVIMKFFG